MPKIMGRKEKEMSPDIARILQQQDLQYHILSEDLEKLVQ
jgi:hypothetical protein